MPIVDEPADEMMSAIAFCTRRPGRGRSHCIFFDVGLVIFFTVQDYRLGKRLAISSGVFRLTRERDVSAHLVAY